MRVPSPLPGYVPQASSLIDKGDRSLAPSAAALPPTTAPSHSGLRGDFAQALEVRLSGWLGDSDSERFARLKPLVGPFLSEGDAPRLSVEKLPKETLDQLVKLQRATEGIESIFVKQILGQLRQTTLGPKKSQMHDMALDMMDQAVADQAAKDRAGIGLAKSLFIDTAQTIVRSAVAQAGPPKETHDND